MSSIFFAIEDMLDEMLPTKLEEHFNQFVDVKNISLGDTTYRFNTDA